MEKAIQRAIEGGYKDHAYCNEFDMYECSTSYCHATVLLDPDFWKALGKAEGWKRQVIISYVSAEPWGNPEVHEGKKAGIWHYHMHRFIDHLIAGKDIDSFFNNLLTN